jgi:hypothetical protein
MYSDLGVLRATALLGIIAAALIPVPVLFFFFGPRIRKMSKFAPKMMPGGGPPGAADRRGMGGPPIPLLLGAGRPAERHDSSKNERSSAETGTTLAPVSPMSPPTTPAVLISPPGRAM